ncbi:MAG: DUF2911 domain-containing protein [Cyclobacteriaceae bacterium]|nr:DUF2911 domain-containing protein [Cyclobacteriaceae bacterium]
MKKTLIVIGVVIAVLMVVGIFLRVSTKSHSPVSTEVFSIDSARIEIVYCRPYKNDREIFGGLEPYGEVWRTGANEATTFSTTVDLKIVDQILPAGKYTLWTIPNETQWEVIFNTEYGQWGVDFSAKANRDATKDQLSVTVPSYQSDNVIEQFTITFEEIEDHIEMILMWDKTTVVVPISL